MSDSPARLVPGRGVSPQDEYTLTLPKTSIGRGTNNEIVINDVEVSRRHAEITRQPDGTYLIEDLGSTNGTFVNGRRSVGRTPLHHGDVIELGESISLTFLYADAEDTPSSYRPPVGVGREEQPPEPDLVFRPAPARAETYPSVASDADAIADFEPAPSRRRWLLGCSCAFLSIIFLCMATLFFLDAYDQGRLLYCGALRPFFEIVLGPFGFAPICP
ncbi:MAG TPA: FHA domain-containing protein [Anaerolineae bacterium]